MSNIAPNNRKSGHRVRVVKEIDSKSIGVSLAGSNPVGVESTF